MPLRRLVLHVGLPKTGSTALQMWCFENREYLLALGIRYPFRNLDETSRKHQFIVEALMHNKFDKVHAALAEGAEATILLSAEGMTNHLYDFQPDALAEFGRLTSAFDVTVFVVSRERQAWIKSRYKQCLINPQNEGYAYGTALDLAEFSNLERVRRLADTRALTKDLAEMYRARDVILADYDQDWMTVFLSIFGLQIKEAPPLTQRPNTSLPDFLIPLIRQINAFNLAPEKRAAWLAEIASCFAIGSNTMRAYSANGSGRVEAEPLDLILLDRLNFTSDEHVEAIEKLRKHLQKHSVSKAAPYVRANTAWLKRLKRMFPLIRQ